MRRRWLRLRQRHPEWWVALPAAIAWLALAWLHLALSTSDRQADLAAQHADHATAALGNRAAGSDLAMEVAVTALMAVAMMAPVALPMVRHVAIASLWHRRTRSAALFLVGFIAVWVLVGLGLSMVIAVATQLTSPAIALAIAVTLATAWQASRRKQRALRRCAWTVPLAPRGWRADSECVRFGVISASSCVATCWGFMAVVAGAGHGIVLMAALFALQLRERRVQSVTRLPSARLVAAVGVLAVMGLST